MTDCLIGLGSNVGERENHLHRAVEILSGHAALANFRHSRWHATRPVGGPAEQGEFLNGAARFDTALSPRELLDALQAAEYEIGRRRGERWGPREIDLDLLLFGEEVICEGNAFANRAANAALHVPHPRMAFRRFVLQPAAEIAADMRHPLIGWTIGQLLDHLENHVPFVAISSTDPQRAADLAVSLAEAAGARLVRSPSPAPFSAEGATSPDEFQRHALEYLEACERLFPKVQDWSPDDLAVSDFHPADVLRHAPPALSAEVFEKLRRRALGAKLSVVDGYPAAIPAAQRPVPLIEGPYLDVSGLPLPDALDEMIAAVRAMEG